MKGYQSGDDLGFPLGSEAVSFLERRCRFPAQRLSRVVPQASAEAIELLDALLTMNPALRPSAEVALGFRYLANVPPLADYSNVRVDRPHPEYFDFELEKHSLASLKAMIAEEVFQAADQPGTAPPLASAVREEPGTPQAEEGPLSQMRTRESGAGHRVGAKDGVVSATRSSIPRRRPSNGGLENRISSGRSSDSESAVIRAEGTYRAGRADDSDILRLERAMAASRVTASSSDRRIEQQASSSGVLSQFQSSYRSLSAQVGERSMVQAQSGTKPSSAAGLVVSQGVARKEYSALNLPKFSAMDKRAGRALPSLLRR